jgi:hypothetical protein
LEAANSAVIAPTSQISSSVRPRIRGDLVGQLRVLRPDAQQRAVGNDAVRAEVGGRGRDDDKLALGLAQPFGPFHERIVVVEERAQFRRAVPEGTEDVGYEARLAGDVADPIAQVVRHVVQLRQREPAVSNDSFELRHPGDWLDQIPSGQGIPRRYWRTHWSGTDPITGSSP